jgi:predicted nicotinamide N-methyase
MIRSQLPLRPAPGFSDIALHLATPGSRLGQLLELAGEADQPPYWAYLWGGGAALARYLSEHPEVVQGRRVLDLGAGGGIVAIAAARAGAAHVVAAEIDAVARVALGLNAAANGVGLEIWGGDETAGEPLAVDVVLAGDVFYAPELGARVLGYLERCRAAGQAVLIGDPWRAFLPRGRLTVLAEYEVGDVGFGRTSTAAAVFTLSATDAKPRD